MKIYRYVIIILAVLSPLFSGCITEDVVRSDNTNVNDIFNGTLSYGLSSVNFTEGLVYKYNNVYIYEHYASQMFAISTNLDMQQNDIVKINVTNTKNITVSGQSGTGTRSACFDAAGHLIASTNATSNYLTC